MFVYPQRDESGIMGSQAPQWCYEEAGVHCWLIMEQGAASVAALWYLWSQNNLMLHLRVALNGQCTEKFKIRM